MKLVRSMSKFLILIAAVCIGGTICFVNTDTVTLNIPFGTPMNLPLANVLVGAFLFGVTTVVFQFGVDVMRKTLETRSLKKRLRRAEEELESLRQRKTSLTSRPEAAPVTGKNEPLNLREPSLNPEPIP